MSDDFRTSTRAGFDLAMQEARKAGVGDKEVAYGLVQAVTGQAKQCMRPDAEISTLSIVLREIGSRK